MISPIDNYEQHLLYLKTPNDSKPERGVTYIPDQLLSSVY